MDLYIPIVEKIATDTIITWKYVKTSQDSSMNNILRLMFSKSLEIKNHNMVDFPLSMKAYVNAQLKLCALDIPKKYLHSSIVEQIGSDNSITPKLQCKYSKTANAMCLYLVLDSLIDQLTFDHVEISNDEYFGMDILFDISKEKNISTIEIFDASNYLDLDLK